MRDEVCKVVSQTCIAKDTYELVLQGSMAKDLQVGQFVNIQLEGCYLRRPLSIADMNDTTFTILYKVVGEGTQKLTTKTVGDNLQILGPLGHGFPLILRKEVVVIGGGIGIPPLYALVKELKKHTVDVHVVLGYTNKEYSFYIEKFKELSDYVYVASDDGSIGEKGNVLDIVRLHKLPNAFVYACGPTRMLEAIQKEFQDGYISYEAHMACGMGACYACSITHKKTQRSERICKEGPVFRLGEVEAI